MQQMDLLHDDPKKLFFKYLLPSISATLVTSIYVLADTIMIGKGVGQDGLAVLNFILPLFTLFFGTGLLLGVGGAVLMSVANGSGDKKLANTYFTHAALSGAFLAILFTVLGLVFLEPIGYMLGCTPVNIGLFTSYAQYLVGFCPVFLFPDIVVQIFIEPTTEVLDMARGAIRIYFAAFIMMSLNIFYSTYFQSVLKPKLSLIICLLRGIIICTILVFLLPLLIGVTGIWLVMPITELITAIIAMMMVRSAKNSI